MAVAAKVTVTISPGLRKKINGLKAEVITNKFVNDSGPVIIKAMKELIAKGISPVKGVGRFAEYKAARKIKQLNRAKKNLTGTRKETAKKNVDNLKSRGYPYSVMKEYPDKKVRPVNLSLTGAMLSNLSFRNNGGSFEVGILPTASNKIKTIARVHNTGERSDIAQRQFIPFEGEEFTATISSKIRTLFKNRILELLNK